MVCAICGGSRQEHFGSDGVTPVTRHMFTEQPGQLITHPTPGEMPKIKEKESTTSLGRLIVALADRGVLSPEDVLFIVSGQKVEGAPSGNGS